MQPKSILITGCSSGIGLCAATLLKERGYRVFATARKSADVEKLRATGFESEQLDVTDTASMQRCLNLILEKTGGTLDALFNNSGYMQAGAVEDLSNDMIQAQFATNVFGPLELTRMVLPIMRQQGYGRIIQNSSILGVISMPYYGAYNASKYALEGFTNTLRQELRDTQIRIILVNPGPIVTALRDNALAVFQQTVNQHEQSPFRKAYAKLEQVYFKRKEKNPGASGPEIVVKSLIHALESKHPRAHYFVGMPAKLMALLRRILPDCLLDWVVNKVK